MSKIMVVEEDRLLRTAIAAYLTRQGHIVWEAIGSVRALEHLEQESVDAILLDTHPTAYGVDLLKQIRNQPALARTPVIALVTTESEIEVLDYVEPGGYVRIPFDMQYLDWMLNRLLSG